MPDTQPETESTPTCPKCGNVFTAIKPDAAAVTCQGCLTVWHPEDLTGERYAYLYRVFHPRSQAEQAREKRIEELDELLAETGKK